ncbi:MAG: amidohydrolase [Proteobacteria bacterium]|nr:amidohydrolase [Pseudomonadota bacterium]
MISGHRIYDTHTHLGTARHSGRRWTVDDMLRHMDAHGVDRSLLIPFPIVEDFRLAHDEIAAALSAARDRFSAAACLPVFIPEAEFRAEVRRCAELGFTAIKLQPQYHALNPVSHRSDFFFETALENRMTVVAHTGSGAPFALPALYIAPARRFPDLRIVLGHAGGSVYYLETIVAAETCPNIYIEFSSLMPHHILEILDRIPANRCLIGSDLPASVDAEIGKIVDLGITESDKADILWNTAARLFDAAT